MSHDSQGSENEVERRGGQADFAGAVYPDQDGMRAMDVLNETISDILDSGLQYEDINTDLLRIAQETGTRDRALAKKAANEFDRLANMIAAQMGVTRDRLEKAAKFRNEAFGSAQADSE